MYGANYDKIPKNLYKSDTAEITIDFLQNSYLLYTDIKRKMPYKYMHNRDSDNQKQII